MTEPDDFSWIRERKECSLANVFELLRQQVKQDVLTRQAMRDPIPESGPNPGYGYGFKFVDGRDSFTVLLEGPQLNERVSFLREPRFIKVTGTDGELIFEAFPSLNIDRKCIVRVHRREYPLEKRECPLWYMRMLALENLFFGVV